MSETGRSNPSRIVQLLMLLLLTTGCSAHLVSTQVPESPGEAGPVPTGGMFYTLPRTVVTVTVPTKLTITKEGELSEFAPLFFYDESKDGLLSAGRKLTLKPATFATRGEPDPTQVYYVKASGRGAVDQSLTFTFTEEGAVTGLKAEVTNNTADVVLAGVGGVAKILAGTALGAAAVATTPRDANLLAAERQIDCPSGDIPGTSVNGANQDAHFRKCYLGANAELIEAFDLLSGEQRRPLLAAYRCLPSDADLTSDLSCEGADPPRRLYRRSLDRALAAYQRYRSLVMGLQEVVTQPSLVPGDISAVLSRNESAAKSLAERFLGTKSELEWNAVFDVLPRRSGDSGCPSGRQKPCAEWTSGSFLTFSDEGFCKRDEFDGLPQPDPRFFAKKCQEEKTLSLTLTLYPDGDQLVSRIAENYRQPSEAGIFYLVPAQMRVELVDSGAGEEAGDRGTDLLMIAQHGIVSALPSKVGGKSFTHNLTYYDASGALKSYSLVSKAMVDKGLVESISNSANTLIEARNKQIEAEKEAADEANQIAAQRALLEDLVKIQKACAELENPPEGCP